VAKKQKKIEDSADWSEKIKRSGWDIVLEDELDEHGELSLERIQKCSRRANQTIREQCQKLVNYGIAKWSPDRSAITLV
jgi:Fic family protein